MASRPTALHAAGAPIRPPGPIAARDESAARRLALALSVLLVLRLTAASLANTTLWSLSAPRFLGWWAGWLPVILAGIGPFLIPSTWFRNVSLRHVAGPVLALGAVLLVWLLADRTWALGDFTWRAIPITTERLSKVFSQFMPGEILLRERVPDWMFGSAQIDRLVYFRVIELTEFALALLLLRHAASALRLVRTRWLFVALALSGGFIGTFTGHGRAMSEMCLFTIGAAVFAIELARGAARGAILGLWMFAALLVHRTALLLVPAAAVAFVLAWRGARRSGAKRTLDLAIGSAVFAIGLATSGTRALNIVQSYDLAHNLDPSRVGLQGGWFVAGTSGLHLLDSLNALALLAPAAVFAVALAGLSPPARYRRDIVIVGLVAVPWSAATLLAHSGMGWFRNWDIVAGAGASLAMLSALVVSVVCDAHPISIRLGSAIAASTALIVIQFMLVQHETRAGLRYVEAFVQETPARLPAEQFATFEFLGTRQVQLGDPWAAVPEFRRAYATIPSRRIGIMWGLAAGYSNDLPEARRAFGELVQRDSSDAVAWAGLWAAAVRTGDSEAAAAAREKLTPLLSRPGARKEVDDFFHFVQPSH